MGFLSKIQGLTGRIVHGGPETDYEEFKQRLGVLAQKEAALRHTTVEQFKADHFSHDYLLRACALSEQQMRANANNNNINQETVAMMQGLISKCALSPRKDGRPGSDKNTPTLIAYALSELDRTATERDWQFLLESALCEIACQRGAPGGDVGHALDGRVHSCHLLPYAGQLGLRSVFLGTHPRSASTHETGRGGRCTDSLGQAER